MHRHSLTPVILVALAGAATAEPFPASLDLSSLDGTDGFVLNGIDAQDTSGCSVSSAGDINGDGIDDLVIGGWSADHGSYLIAGESYVVFGGQCVGSVGSIDLASLDGSNGFVITGIATGDNSGASVSHADLNNDGIDDVIIGATGANPAGQTYVIFGRDTPIEGDFPGALDPSSLDGSNGFVINGAVFDSRTGNSVASAGDFNGDGVEDAILGTAEYANESYVVFGRDTPTQGNFPASIDVGALDGTDGFVIHGIDPYDYIGISVASAGDVNGDGTDDVIVGAPYASPNAQNYSGASYVIFGGPAVATSGTFDLSILDGTNGFVVTGVDADDESGASVASAGDLDGDGIDDIIIGASYASPDGAQFAGAAYIFFGRDTGVEGDFPASLSLASLDGANGFKVPGRQEYSACGFSVSGAGDVNADQIDDIAIGASERFLASPGEAYIVFGRNAATQGDFPASLHPSSLDGSNGFIAHGVDPGDSAGASVCCAGDVNADGIGDIIIGAPDADADGSFGAGETYVIFGGPPPPAADHTLFSAHGVDEGLPSISCVAVADLDGDLDPDLVASGPSILWYENDGGSPPVWTEHVLLTELEGGAINVQALDVDGDTDIDILTASGTWGDSIEWLESDGLSPPGFTRHVVQAGLTRPRAVCGFDIDADGDQDIGSVLMDDDVVEWYESDGAMPPAFTRHVLLTDAPTPQYVTAADLDGDTDGDLVYAAPEDDRVAWLENLGGTPPTFAHHILAQDPDGPENPGDGIADGVRQVKTVDIDGDADLDIVAACSGSSRLLLFLNDGQASPQFTATTVYQGSRVDAVRTIDVDGDCDIDIVHGSGTDHLVAWQENGGGSPPAWTAHWITDLGQAHKDLDVADFDGDGAIDVVSVSPTDGWIAWYQSGHCRADLDGNGTTDVFDFGIFADHFGTEPGFLSSGDLDGDGDVDVFDFALFGPDFGCTP